MDTLERCSADAAGRREHAGRRGGCITPSPSPSPLCSRRAKGVMIVEAELKNRRRRGSRGKGSKRRHREAWLARIGAAFVASAHQQEKEGSSLELQQKQKQAHLDQGAAKSGDLESQRAEAKEVSRSGVGKATSRVQVGAHQDRGAAQSETKTSCDVQDHHSGSQVSTSEAGRSAHHTGAANMEDKEKDSGVQWQYAGLFGAAWILFPVASFWTQLALSVVVCVFVSWFGGTGSAVASTRMVAASTVKKTRTSKQQRVKLKWGRVFELMVEHGLAGEEARLHQQVQRLESALQVERDKRREDFQRHIEAAFKMQDEVSVLRLRLYELSERK